MSEFLEFTDRYGDPIFLRKEHIMAAWKDHCVLDRDEQKARLINGTTIVCGGDARSFVQEPIREVMRLIDGDISS